MNEELEFENELIAILDKYDEGNGETWKETPLDGDEVDTLVEHLRNQLNLLNGNITKEEYIKLETLKDVIEKLRDYIYADYHRLEEFTDIEICNENDWSKAKDMTDMLLYNLITSQDINKMYEELNNYNIDLVKWGALYNNGNIEE